MLEIVVDFDVLVPSDVDKVVDSLNVQNDDTHENTHQGSENPYRATKRNGCWVN
jgi:hypothetical protein